MYRLYDHKEKAWVRDDFYVSFFGDVYLSKKTLFGNDKMSLASENQYTLHQDIGYYDKNGRLIFEGDICEIVIDDKVLVCVVAYVAERASYMLLDYKYNSYYQFYEGVKERVEVIGNVLENQNLVEFESDELAGEVS